MEFIKIQALKTRDGKPQHLVAGKVYSVDTFTGLHIIDSKQGIEAQPNQEAGQVYDLPKVDKPKAKKPAPPKNTDDLLG